MSKLDDLKLVFLDSVRKHVRDQNAMVSIEEIFDVVLITAQEEKEDSSTHHQRKEIFNDAICLAAALMDCPHYPKCVEECDHAVRARRIRALQTPE